MKETITNQWAAPIDAPLEHPGVTEGLGQHRPGAGALVGEPRRVGLAQPDHRRDGQDGAHRQHDGRDRDGARQDGGDDLRDAHLRRASSIGCPPTCYP